MVKAYKGMAMEGMIARWYTKSARQGRGFDELAERVCDLVPVGGSVLEVASGPVFLRSRLARAGRYHVAGIDISHTFVEIEKANARDAGVDIHFRQGDAANLPFENSSFDFVICTAAFKNFTRPAEALSEMYRVLRPQGKALVIDLRHDASCARSTGRWRGWGWIGSTRSSRS